MDPKTVFPVVFLILFCLGLFFLGKGMTGYVVSETCCFPPDCSSENICDSSNTPVKNAGTMGMGIMFVLVSALVFVMIQNRINSI